MFKKLAAVIFLLIMFCGTSWGGTTNNTYFDPYSLNTWISNDNFIYSRYGTSDLGFFYQLRDITGASRQDRVGGPQWFATIYENYYSNLYRINTDEDTNTGYTPYRRTAGGGLPDVRLNVSGNLLDGFNYILLEEPEPYEGMLRRNYATLRQYYDLYPDPVESICFVITNGQGEFNINFANPYARHFPFWWDWNTNYPARTPSSTRVAAERWWTRYSWMDQHYRTTEPVEYIIAADSRDILKRDSNGVYRKEFTNVVSGDYTLINDTSGNTVYILSGDSVYDTDNELVCTIDEDNTKIYGANGGLLWIIESDTQGTYICKPRSIEESIAMDMSGLDYDYDFTIIPAQETSVFPDEYLNANVKIRGIDGDIYGSELGYISFKQRASFLPGYENFREASTIPVVIANVSPGNAADNPLIFDMTIYSSSSDRKAADGSDIVSRVKFTWDAQTDKPDQDLGTFFMMSPYNSSMPTYYLETRITNRTGTRYELYRYDMLRARSGDVEYRDGFANILPNHWEYDITQDTYGTLPDRFLLDAHSQIAPGLVTVYDHAVYGTLDTTYDTRESFRLYEYASTAPKNLRLNYKRIAGMTAGIASNIPADGGSIRGFNMAFTDIMQDSDNTEDEIEALTGKLPAMISDTDPSVFAEEAYINKDAMNSFRITRIIGTDGRVELDFDDELNYGLLAVSEDVSEDVDIGGEEEGEFSDSASIVKSIYSSDRVALQPVYVRLRIPRSSQLLQERWNELEEAANTRALFEKFASFGAVWVRSEATTEFDTNLFTAINNKGNGRGISAADCISAFINNDYLYLDFIVIMADAESLDSRKSAFINLIEDDGVPYIIIGDGAVDMMWDLTFFVGENKENPSAGNISGVDIADQPEPILEGKSSENGNCNLGLIGLAGIAVMILALKKR